jgi:hypothetical protein
MLINETDIPVVMSVSSVQLFVYHNRMSLKTFPGIVYAEASYCVEISETEGSVVVFMLLYFHISPFHCGAWGGVVVKALRYYSDGSGIDSRWYHWIFQ